MKRSIAVSSVIVCLSVGMALPASGNYSGGQEAYLLKQYEKALKEFMADDDPKSLYKIGYMYDHGEGVPEDAKQAAEWYRKAAEKGSAPAQYRLGMKYANGFGVEKDMAEAVKWYKKAADRGFQPAKDALKRLENAR